MQPISNELGTILTGDACDSVQHGVSFDSDLCSEVAKLARFGHSELPSVGGVQNATEALDEGDYVTIGKIAKCDAARGRALDMLIQPERNAFFDARPFSLRAEKQVTNSPTVTFRDTRIQNFDARHKSFINVREA